MTASYSATKHLLELGHKRIAFFSGAPAAPSSHERLDGYRRALREANIEPDDKLIFNAGSTTEEGEAAALQMLNEAPKATAVQTANDLVAIGAATVFLKQGSGIWQHSGQRIFSCPAHYNPAAEASAWDCGDGFHGAADPRRASR